jgi:hypothetical protein
MIICVSILRVHHQHGVLNLVQEVKKVATTTMVIQGFQVLMTLRSRIHLEIFINSNRNTEITTQNRKKVSSSNREGSISTTETKMEESITHLREALRKTLKISLGKPRKSLRKTMKNTIKIIRNQAGHGIINKDRNKITISSKSRDTKIISQTLISRSRMISSSLRLHLNSGLKNNNNSNL